MTAPEASPSLQAARIRPSRQAIGASEAGSLSEGVSGPSAVIPGDAASSGDRVRMALGARRRVVVWLAVRHGLSAVGVGAGLGLVLYHRCGWPPEDPT
ncbi:hypothetical protein DB31_0137 [Hyalangium minutum]|uniref:Uncharacterized protein n=1 Tax=Hyalangium minutum TaxID=394096 RepID=A0A085WW13_9BACT|nr:hypothetical protein DB31_0137 [Hyalangium minutum]